MWGRNNFSQQGNGDVSKASVLSHTEVKGEIAKSIDKNKDAKIKMISTRGAAVSAAVLNYKGTDHLYMWGKNKWGNIGIGTRTEEIVVPTESDFQLKDFTSIKEISASEDTSAAIIGKKDGKDHVYMWGKNNKIQCGQKDEDFIETPEEIEIKGAKEMKQISAGIHFGMIIIKNEDGDEKLYIWGGEGKYLDRWRDDYGLLPEEVRTIEINKPIIKNIETKQIGSSKFKLNFDFDPPVDSIESKLFNYLKPKVVGLSVGPDGRGTDLGDFTYGHKEVVIDVKNTANLSQEINNYKINASLSNKDHSQELKGDFLVNIPAFEKNGLQTPDIKNITSEQIGEQKAQINFDLTKKASGDQGKATEDKKIKAKVKDIWISSKKEGRLNITFEKEKESFGIKNAIINHLKIGKHSYFILNATYTGAFNENSNSNGELMISYPMPEFETTEIIPSSSSAIHLYQPFVIAIVAITSLMVVIFTSKQRKSKR